MYAVIGAAVGGFLVGAVLAAAMARRQIVVESGTLKITVSSERELAAVLAQIKSAGPPSPVPTMSVNVSSSDDDDFIQKLEAQLKRDVPPKRPM